MFFNEHGKQFEDLSAVSGLDRASDSRSFGMLDYDRDGWQDIVLVNANAPKLELFRNQIGERPGQVGGVVALRFVGGNREAAPSTEWSSREAYGTQVVLDVGNGRILRELRCGEGLAAQNSATMIVGIGAEQSVRRMTVRWPSGQEQILENIAVGSLVTVFENPTDAPDGSGARTETYRVPIERPASPTATAGTRLPVEHDDKNGTPALRVYVTMSTTCETTPDWLPQLTQLRRAFGADQVGLYGVPTDANDTAEQLQDFLVEYRPDYDLLIGIDPKVAQEVKQAGTRAVGGETLPTTLVTAADGQLRFARTGIPNVSQIGRLLAGEKSNKD